MNLLEKLPILKLLFIFFLYNSILAEDLVLKNVSYLQSDTLEFSQPTEIQIRKQKIQKIISLQSSNNRSKYVIPSMCDAFVTLGVDSLGGQNDRNAIYTSLKSFLYHGFTHIQVVTDGKWIYDIKKKIQKGKILGPQIIVAQRPILTKNQETSNLPKQLYFVGEDKRSIYQEVLRQTNKNSKLIHIFHRFHDSGYNMKSFLFYRLNKLVERRNKVLMLTTFGDRFSILEALRAGIRYIHHPIPKSFQKDFDLSYSKDLHWSPGFLPYYFLELQGKQDELQKVYEYMYTMSHFFRRNYSDKMKPQLETNTLEMEEIEKVKKEFSSYWDFFKDNSILWKNLILSSNSGSRFAFPGIGGLIELKLYSSVIGNNKTLLNIPTQNTCSLISKTYKGKIQEGEIANLLVLKKNPMESFENMFEIESVILNGKKIDREKLLK